MNIYIYLIPLVIWVLSNIVFNYLLHKRIGVLENHPEITKNHVCSSCHLQVARYYISKEGHLICANCDPSKFQTYSTRKTTYRD